MVVFSRAGFVNISPGRLSRIGMMNFEYSAVRIATKERMLGLWSVPQQSVDFKTGNNNRHSYIL